MKTASLFVLLVFSMPVFAQDFETRLASLESKVEQLAANMVATNNRLLDENAKLRQDVGELKQILTRMQSPTPIFSSTTTTTSSMSSYDSAKMSGRQPVRKIINRVLHPFGGRLGGKGSCGGG